MAISNVKKIYSRTEVDDVMALDRLSGLMPEQEERPFSGPLTDEEHACSDQAIRWFVRLRSEHLTGEERARFEAWRQQSRAHDQAFRDVCALWGEEELAAAAVQTEQATVDSDTVSVSFRPRSRFAWATIAAAVVLACVAVTHQFDLMTRMQADYYTATGEQRTVQLPDGSTARLNTDTAMATDFAGSTRRMRLLKGEAFFAVQPDASRPFLVEAGGVTTRAIGTEFLVRERGAEVQVTVVHGTVELSANTPRWPAVRLTDHQHVHINRDGPSEPRTVDPQTMTAWMRGRLVFDTARLADVVAEVQRYHPGYVLISNSAIGDIHVSGTYHLSDTSGILRTLARTLPIRMVRVTDRLIVLY